MKQTVKVVYILVLVAIALLIFIGHARLKVPDVVRSLDYVCDTLIPLSTIMGAVYFRTLEPGLGIANAVILVCFLVASIFYYLFHIYYGVLFAVTDFMLITLTTYVLFSKRV
jgi:hypothetical protein